MAGGHPQHVAPVKKSAGLLDGLRELVRGRRESPEDCTVPRRLHDAPSREDVYHAFRLILGRELQDEPAMQAHLQISSVAELRRVMLESVEFSDKYNAMHPDVHQHPDLAYERRTVVLLHLEKTGGTSLRELVAQAFAADRRCPLFENRLHTLTLAQLGRYDFYSGHFDAASIRFIPRQRLEVVSMFREPVSRLVSLYRFLRAHPMVDEFVGHKLVALAHRYSAEEFFEQPQIRLFSNINNHYVVVLGKSYLWFEQHARSLRPGDMEDGVRQARATISDMASLGLTEHYEESVALICRDLAIPMPASIARLNATDGSAARDARFSRVDPVELTPRLLAAVADLTAYDTQLYRFAVEEFGRRRQGGVAVAARSTVTAG
jgi:hypothetical protein